MGKQVTYFDNAATTFPKPDEVYDFADSFYRENGGNIGRGHHTLASNAGLIASQAKENIKKLYGCPGKKVVFTPSATDALNRILLGLGLQKGEVVYITPFEHNAVTRPLHHIKTSCGIEIEELSFNPLTLLAEYSEIENAFRKNPPRLVVMTHASNVCGAVIPVLEVCRLAKEYGATTVIDMSQTMGLLDLDLGSELIDFAVFAGHKTLYGPFGIGGFVCTPSAQLNPVVFGGNGINSLDQEMPKDMAQMIEIGSQNVYAIAGLKASTDWILEQGMDSIRERESQATSDLLCLLAGFENVSIVAQEMKCERIGVVSAVFDGYSPDEIEQILNNNDIAVRSGLHCSPYAHRFLATLPLGAVRFSVGAFTGREDFNVLKTVLEMISAGE